MDTQVFQHSRRQFARSFTTVMGTILILFTGSLYTWEVHNQRWGFDEDLQITARVMASSIKVEPRQGQWRVNLNEVPFLGGKTQPIDHELVYVRWFDADGSLRQFVGPPPTLTLGDPPGLATVGSVRQLTIAVEHEGRRLGYLQIGEPLDTLSRSLQRLRWAVVLGVPATLGLIAGVSWILADRAMQPVRQAYLSLHQFTADASHELRAPLAALMSNAQLGILAPEQAPHRLEKIVSTTRRMSTLVETLLTLARQQGSLDLQALPVVDLAELLQDLSQTYAPQVTAQQLTWQCHLPPGSWSVRGQRELLHQAIDNLLRNALHYTPAGGSITVSLSQRDPWIVVQVADTGIGIAPEHLPHLGERFYRVDTARSRHTGGFGLGLALVKQIVAAHGGFLTIASQPQQGSQFSLHLPRVPSLSCHFPLASSKHG